MTGENHYFNPMNYMDVLGSKKFKEEITENSPIAETLRRIIVGRAYYSAIITIRDTLISDVKMQRVVNHKQMIRKIPNPEIKNILWDMKILREKADYNTSQYFSPEEYQRQIRNFKKVKTYITEELNDDKEKILSEEK